MTDIHLLIDGAQHGPYTAAQLQTWVRDGTVAADTLAWREGMAEWQPVSSLVAAPGASRRAAMPQHPQPARRPQPYRPPGYSYAGQALEPEGFNRMQYFGISFLANLLIFGVLALIAVFVAGASRVGTIGEDEMATVGGSILLVWVAAVLLSFGISLWLGVKRLQNIGWSGALILLVLVPFVGAVLGVMLLALPPGYARNKQLDGPAWFWIIVSVLLVVGGIAAALMGGLEALRQVQSAHPR